VKILSHSTTTNGEVKMSIIKRLSATVVSSIDSLVGEIEDHNAVVEVAIKDLQKQIAEAKVRLNRVNQEQLKIKQQISDTQLKASAWKQRAIESAKDDEAKALECLNRSKTHKDQVKGLDASHEEYKVTSRKLSEITGKLEKALIEAKRKQTIMRARQSSSRAVTMNSGNFDAQKDLTDTFERWEVNLVNAEMNEDNTLDDVSIDSFEEQFITQEKRDTLKMELDVLIKEQDND